LGLEIEAVEEDEFDEYLNQAFSDKSKQDGISGLITAVGPENVKKVLIGAENDYTVQVLYRLGVKWPIISEEYIYKFIEYLNDLAFFE
jgi:predicted secreted protein